MLLIRLIPPILTLLTRAQAAEPTNYGHWRLRLYETWSFTGSYSKNSVYSEYWTPTGNLGTIVYCADEHNPDSRGRIYTPCNDTSFSCNRLRSDSECSLSSASLKLLGMVIPC